MRLSPAAALCAVLFPAAATPAAGQPAAPAPSPGPARRSISLDGTWRIAQGPFAAMPKEFPAEVQVPGLADMAVPPFADVGKKSPLREAFWYRRSFRVDGPVPEFAALEIRKACYGTRVWINGREAGEHLPCFTPGRFEVAKLLAGGGAENEIVVRVGAGRDALPKDVPAGWDFEKYLYIPGIYDSVDLVLTGAPRIRNVQVVPRVEARTVRAVVELEAGAAPVADLALEAAVFPVGSPGTDVRGPLVAVARRVVPAAPLRAGEVAVRELSLAIPDARLWSPEDPFLYRLLLGVPGGDSVAVRFGMRSFRFDPATRRAVLNGRPYYLRGTNVCAYRFFEDAGRGDKPWRAEWVRRLHEKFKAMGWNSMRWCIGFPPDFWYDIADETGWLIQDEFPIWLLGEAPESPTAENIIPQYVEWMRERWNHPCVVIWDGQNESETKETGKAIGAVRRLDLSDRPWENGWAEPQAPTDPVETHPYLMIGLFNPAWGNGKFRMADLAGLPAAPPLNDAQRKLSAATIINEYAWLWLDRDGSPTCLTAPVYEKLLGPKSTVEARRRLYARYLAAKTEFWRAGRACAGVLHFCGLGYSRAGDRPRPEGGATSDHFTDLEKLTFEPLFEEYLRDAFSPVGVMLDLWDEDLAGGSSRAVKVVVIDDLDRDWTGTVKLAVRQGERVVSETSKPCKVAALGREVLSFDLPVPGEPGRYEATAELSGADGRRVRSRREFDVRPAPAGKK